MSENNNSIGMNELVDYRQKDYGKFRWGIMRFLWKCAGADSQILKYAPFSDHIKAAGIGGVVLATTVMATVAMGFAMHTIFGENTKHGHEGNWAITIPAALVWGIIIFNLDRFIVSTVKGDGTEKITWAEWGAMLPRLVMAIIIGLTISAPLETYIFQTEITREWSRVQNKLSQNRQNELELKYSKENNNLDSLAKVAQKDLDSSQSRFKRNDLIVTWIVNGINGYGPCNGGENCQGNLAHREVYKSRNQARADMEKAQTKLDDVKVDKQKLLDKIRKEKDKEGGIIENSKPGFLDQLMMLENLSSRGENFTPVDTEGRPVMEEDGTTEKVEELYGAAWAPIWLVRLLFIIVEIAPVIFKFMIWDSSYDYMKDNVAQILEAKQGISLESFPDENNNTHRIRKNYNAERIVEVSKRQNDLEKENAIHAITLYAEQERKEIEDNPEDFVKNKDHDSTPTESNEPENNA
jgi:hypothetical protein